MDMGGTFSVRRIYIIGGYFSHMLNGAAVRVGMNADITQNPTVHNVVMSASLDSRTEFILSTPAVGRYFGFTRGGSRLLFCKIEVYEY